MDKRKARKIHAIELEYGQDFVDVLKDFAKDCSFSFTMQALELNHKTFADYKHLFTPKRMPKLARPHITKRNLENAPKHNGKTVREWVAETGLSRSTIHYRIKHGIKLDAPNQNRGAVNFGKNRNTSKWKEQIHAHAQEVMEGR